jgi:hypothetical protein
LKLHKKYFAPLELWENPYKGFLLTQCSSGAYSNLLFMRFQRAKFLLQRSNMLIAIEFRIVRSLQRSEIELKIFRFDMPDNILMEKPD